MLFCGNLTPAKGKVERFQFYGWVHSHIQTRNGSLDDGLSTSALFDVARIAEHVVAIYLQPLLHAQVNQIDHFSMRCSLNLILFELALQEITCAPT